MDNPEEWTPSTTGPLPDDQGTAGGCDGILKLTTLMDRVLIESQICEALWRRTSNWTNLTLFHMRFDVLFCPYYHAQFVWRQRWFVFNLFSSLISDLDCILDISPPSRPGLLVSIPFLEGCFR